MTDRSDAPSNTDDAVVEKSPYETLGGDSAVRALVDRFYDEMDRDPEVAALRAMHATDLSASRDKLYWFMSGWLGGPPMYVERKGHPRLRARHLPFAIDASAAAQWMRCMRVALGESGLQSPMRERLDDALDRLATHMINA